MMTPARKRMRAEGGCGSSSTEESLKPSATINDLPSEVLKNIFTFVGKGNYYFIGPVSKDFCFNYLTMDVIEDKFAHKMDYQLAIGKNKITTAAGDASSSFDLAEYCFFKAPEDFQTQAVLNAVSKGRKDIVEMGIAMGVDITDSISYKEIREIARRGDLGMFKILQQKGVNFKYHSCTIVLAAAENDHLEILKWLHENKWLSSSDRFHKQIFEEAARNGHISTLEWAKDTAGFDFPYLTSYVAATGNLDMIKNLRSKDISWDEFTFCDAAYSGNIALLQYLLENDCDHDDPRICTFAVINDDHEKALEVLQWLHNQGVPWNANTCATAAQEGNMQALKYLKENDCPWNELCIKKTVQSRNVEVVEFLLQNSCPIGNNDICSIAMKDIDHDRALKMLKVLREFSVPWSRETCRAATEYGNFTALKWAVTQGCPWNRRDSAYDAAERGDIGVLKWIKSYGLQWDEYICGRAAKKGHVETLKFLISQGCELNEYIFFKAVESGNFAMVEYCVNNDPFPDYSCYDDAIEHFEDPIPVIKLFQKKQYPWHELACTKAARKGDLKLLRWIRFLGCPWDEKTCNEAVKNNDLDILKYAHESGCPWTIDTFAYCYSECGVFYNTEDIPTDHRCSDDIIEYLRIHKCPQPDPEDWYHFHGEFMGDY